MLRLHRFPAIYSMNRMSLYYNCKVNPHYVLGCRRSLALNHLQAKTFSVSHEANIIII